MQYLDAVDATEILQRRRQRCGKATRIVLADTIDQEDHIL